MTGLKYFINALPVVAAAVALAATTSWVGWTIAGCALIATCALLYFLEGHHAHRLTEGTEKFISFYRSWYARKGTHLIFCDDLAWLEGAENDPIVEQLRRAGSHVHVWVRDDSSPRARELRDAGVQVARIPLIAEIHVPMSLHKHDGDEQLIIREKGGYRRQSPRQTIRFIETSDRHTTKLADEFFRFCDHFAPVANGAPELRESEGLPV